MTDTAADRIRAATDGRGIIATADLNELLDAVEQLPAAWPADFFQAGKTYIEAKPFTAPEGLIVFRCIAVDRFPGNGDQPGGILAFGFATPAYPGNHWSVYLCRQEAWSDGWTEYDETESEAG